MKIGVMSDSHDNMPMIRKAIRLFTDEGVEAVLHAGDFVAPFAVKEIMKFQGRVKAVFGNNDGEKEGILKLGFDVSGPPRTVEMGGRRVLLCHVRPEDTESADVAIFGHTHAVEIEEGAPLALNPGECGGWLTGKCTVALLDLESLKVEIKEL
ncbi:MAG: metallophosphoesterase [Planctomycetes bacterium]|nr:metallophosphoesterase [Planctomycetota bacterium]